ncbi:hypothetical protein HAX54_035634 [Datura stramonium]|uniref:Uncharacterized protein n=1 Tax=Datura stramonium TaxID=4076 RepID=A0ABS8SFF5_DATST|nr:hypothetical protein [Datura stramonium]
METSEEENPAVFLTVLRATRGKRNPSLTKKEKMNQMMTGKPSAKKKEKKTFSKSEKEPQEDEEVPDQFTSSKHYDADDAHDDTEAERTIRKSTRTAVIVKQAGAGDQAALQATMKPLILVYLVCNPVSCAGSSYLEFVNGASFDSQISTTSTPYPQKAVCAVTGLPAREVSIRASLLREVSQLQPNVLPWLLLSSLNLFWSCQCLFLVFTCDVGHSVGPANSRYRTGISSYATKEAFKIIRERYAEESSRAREWKTYGRVVSGDFWARIHLETKEVNSSK